jgi:hypothetical protein
MKPVDYNRAERCFDRIIRHFRDKPTSTDYRNAVNARSLLQQHADQWAGRFVPDLDAVLLFARSEDDKFNSEETLSPEQWAVIWQIDEKSTVRQIAHRLGWDENEIRRVVYSLLGTEYVRLESQQAKV